MPFKVSRWLFWQLKSLIRNDLVEFRHLFESIIVNVDDLDIVEELEVSEKSDAAVQKLHHVQSFARFALL